MRINDIDSHSGEVNDMIILIREMSKTDAKEVIVGYFTSKGEVTIKIRL